MTYTMLDYAVFFLVGALALLGASRGFTAEAIGLLAWVAAVFAVRLFHEDATRWLTPMAGGPGRAAVAAFLALFLGTLILGKLLAGLSGLVTANPVIGPVDRVLGLGLGAAKGLVAASALFLLANFGTHVFRDDRDAPAWIARSQTAPILAVTSQALVNWVKTAGEPEPPKPAPNTAKGAGYSKSDREALDALTR